MQFELNQTVGAFRVTNLRRSSELHAEAVELVHEKTSCPVFWLNNGAENKVFSIAFRTLPGDDTGVFHILEHSVLCGSEKYPVREPFVELLKGSMNTFLNAMTFQDMTMYPVSSRNDRDLLNLAGVYLDAVFRPRCLQDERIFRQEGWRIDRDESGRPVYQGVVFNEMKGAMSDVDTLGDRNLDRQLFPDTAYGFNSGGDPEHIPDLTWAQFREQYRLHYHPSNAVIYLDGAVPMDEMLPLLASYLDAYTPMKDLPAAGFQTPVSSDRTIEFELGQEEDPEDRGQLYLARITGTWRDRTRNMALSLIGEVLTGHNDAPLKRLILEKELAQDVSLTVDDSGLQSFLILHAENVADGCEDELLREIRLFGEHLAEQGLDRDAVEASLNRMVFSLKEEEEPQGIDRAVRCVDIWLYGGDPLAALEVDPSIAELRNMVASGELDRLAAELFRADEGTCILRLHPSKALRDRRRRAEEARLAKITESWTEAEKSGNEALLSSLRAWQSAPDSPEALSSLPMLKKEDADIAPAWTETEDLLVDGVRLLQHRLSCAGIVYLRISFSLSDLSPDEILRANMVSSLLGKLPTARYDAPTLQREIRRWTGRLGFSVSCRAHPTDPSRCAPTLSVFVSVLPENVKKAQELVSEILLHTDFSDTDRIMEIVMQIELSIRQRMISSGQYIASRNVLSHYSAEFALKNKLEGDEAVRYVHAFVREPEKALRELRETAEKLQSRTFCRARALLSLTADESIDWHPFLSALPLGELVSPYLSVTRDASPRRGYRIPAQVGYAVRGYRLSECGIPFHGAMWLASGILSLNYLWNQIRVQGGAYGAGFSIDRFGNMYSWSYRDPSPDRTLAADAGLADALRAFADSGESLDKYIISSLNDLNPLLSPREKGALADSRYLNGYTREMAERIRKEILYATESDLLRCCEFLDAFAQNGAVCVVAPDDSLRKCKNLDIEDL